MDIYGLIREFNDRLETNPLSSGQIALWYALMYSNNKARWQEWFAVAGSVLTNRSGLDRSSIIRARNVLKQAGFINFRTRGNLATEYSLLHSATADATADAQADAPAGATADATADAPINNTNTKTKTNTKNTPHNPPRGAEERFDRFWSAYPKKVAKPAARKAFDRLKPDDGLIGLMLAALEKHKATDQWTRDGGQFIPNPATWLNQKRWEDDLPTGVKGRQVSAQQYQQRDYTDHDLQGDTDWLAVAQQEAGMRGATP